MKTNFLNSKQRGFTLVEMLIAVSLFIVIVTISLGALLSVFDANKKNQSSKTISDNLNFAIDDITRSVRFGTNYYCGISSGLTSVNNCSSGGSAVSATFESKRIIYSWGGTENSPIMKSSDGGLNYLAITAPEVKIQHLKFYVFGSDSSDINQPYVIAVIKGYIGNKPTTRSVFSIQTLMSQRKLDI
jgi:type II secretory pathway pseudopilin PulG